MYTICVQNTPFIIGHMLGRKQIIAATKECLELVLKLQHFLLQYLNTVYKERVRRELLRNVSSTTHSFTNHGTPHIQYCVTGLCHLPPWQPLVIVAL